MTPSTGEPQKLPGGNEASAAEYVLGLLPQEERSAFDARAATDVDLQQDVAAWKEYFSTFAEGIPSKTPPQFVRAQVEHRVFGKPHVPIWKQVAPYLIGAILGSVLTWFFQ